MRIERRKARSRAFVYGIVVLAIMLIMTMMIIVVMQKTKPRPQFLFIQNGTLVHSVKSQALILRDDTVLTAPVSGTLQPLASEGTRVARGQKIALIIPTGLESQLSELNKCEQDIVDLQNELMNQGKGAGARAIFNESGVALSSIVNLVRADLANGSLANLPTYAASLSVVMDQRSSKLTSIDFHDARLDQLLVQRTTLEQSLGIASGTIYSDQPGIVSFNLDGYESALGVTAVESLSLNQIQDVQKQAGSHQPVEQLVTAGQPILRVTSSREQYLAFYLDGLNASQLDPDRTYSLDVPSDGTRIEGCRLVRTESDDQGTLVIFGTDRKVEWFADRRTFETELAIAETSGMKIPRVSLINFSPEQRRADIMLVNGGYTWQVPVVVTDYDREYAIIEALPEDQAVTGDAAILAAGESPDQTDASARTAALRPAVSTVIVANPESIAAGEFIGE